MFGTVSDAWVSWTQYIEIMNDVARQPVDMLCGLEKTASIKELWSLLIRCILIVDVGMILMPMLAWSVVDALWRLLQVPAQEVCL